MQRDQVQSWSFPMKIALPLAMAAMIGLASLTGVASATTAPAASTATAQPAKKVSHETCKKEAEAKHLTGEARKEFMTSCEKGDAPAAKAK
jgi:hypothetical protein